MISVAVRAESSFSTEWWGPSIQVDFMTIVSLRMYSDVSQIINARVKIDCTIV